MLIKDQCSNHWAKDFTPWCSYKLEAMQNLLYELIISIQSLHSPSSRKSSFLMKESHHLVKKKSNPGRAPWKLQQIWSIAEKFPAPWLGIKPRFTCIYAWPRKAVGNVSGYRCVSDCRSRGREFDPSPVPYFRGDWSWNNFYGHSPPFRWFIQEGLLSVTSESMCTNYWLTACSSLPRKKCG